MNAEKKTLDVRCDEEENLVDMFLLPFTMGYYAYNYKLSGKIFTFVITSLINYQHNIQYFTVNCCWILLLTSQYPLAYDMFFAVGYPSL